MRKMGVVVMALLWSGCVVDVDRNPGVAVQSSSGSNSGVSQDNRSSSGGCSGFGPICVQGSPGGNCGDNGRQAICTNGNWACPAGFIPNDQCACTGPQCGSSSRPNSSSGVDACLAACGVGCAPNLCDSEGNRFCSECTAACYGVTGGLSECEASVCTPGGACGAGEAPCTNGTRTCSCGVTVPQLVCSCVGNQWACPALDRCADACPSSSSGGSSSGNNVEACVAGCGLGCPPQPYCDSTGQFYCNQCVAGCYGVTEELRLCSSTSSGPSTSSSGNREACIDACGFGCANLCDSRGTRFCSECTAACDGVTEPLRLCTDGPVDAGTLSFDGGVPDSDAGPGG